MPVLHSIKIRGIKIGEGIPKICVPLIGNTKEELLRQAEEIQKLPVDLVEWRADLFDGIQEQVSVIELLKELRKLVEEKPLLFTCRTKFEGGGMAVSQGCYAELNLAAAKSGAADLIDIEAFFGQNPDSQIEQTENSFSGKLIAKIKAAGVPVIASNHDFNATPSKEELIRRLCRMQELHADIVKLAVMPQCPADVLELLSATEIMVRQFAKQPVVTMSMGAKGAVSRLSGELFGSALTFGAAGKGSAPGQLPVHQLREVLEILHESR